MHHSIPVQSEIILPYFNSIEGPRTHNGRITVQTWLQNTLSR